jgi:hypothetical protein
MEHANTFTDLAAFQHVATPSAATKSSIIKSSEVSVGGKAIIEVLDGNHSEPTVYIHRDGDKILKIEFTCSCGKSTHLDLEYEGE